MGCVGIEVFQVRHTSIGNGFRGNILISVLEMWIFHVPTRQTHLKIVFIVSRKFNKRVWVSEMIEGLTINYVNIVLKKWAQRRGRRKLCTGHVPSLPLLRCIHSLWTWPIPSSSQVCAFPIGMCHPFIFLGVYIPCRHDSSLPLPRCVHFL